jgi:CRP/FNR family cyclic AMP-dependent transcriptional regulator
VQTLEDRPASLRPYRTSPDSAPVATFEAGAALFSQGDADDCVMYIEAGRVHLVVTTEDGREAICGVLGPGAFLGEEALNGHRVRRQTAIAMAHTQVVVFPREQMRRLLQTHDALAARFLGHLLARNARLEHDLCDQLLYPSEMRLAHTLMALAGCDGQSPCGCTVPAVTQEAIAEMVGTTRSRVNAFLGKFKKIGFLEEDEDGLHVKPSLLHALHNGEARPTSR